MGIIPWLIANKTPAQRAHDGTWRMLYGRAGLLILGGCLALSSAYPHPKADSVATPSTINTSNTKKSLVEVEKKIHQMQQRLAQVQDKQSLIKQELTHTEKRIHDTQTQLQKTQDQYRLKQHEITQLETQQQPLEKQYLSLQSALSHIIVSRYKMTDQKKLMQSLQQQNPQNRNRLLVYYRYLLRANQHLIDQLKITQHALTEKKLVLNRELASLTNIQQTLKHQEEKLTANQQYRTALLQSLNQDLHETQKNLETFRLSQAHLSKLLKTLNQQSVLQTRYPFSQMKRKLDRPIKNNSKEQHLNQGILFPAPEGTPIQAIFPGKIVFSDWLNAYGLLIIIDHGWGFMTLYANNQAILKHKGDSVNQGEEIARAGHSGAFRQNGLYFEIRHRGKTVPPLQWLK